MTWEDSQEAAGRAILEKRFPGSRAADL